MSRDKSNLSREKIGAAAVAIADRYGFRAVTMRRIARQLDVGTMSLYYYVKTKDDLIAVMDDVLMGEMLLPSLPRGWRSGLLAIAERTHAVLLRHPWAISTMLTAPPRRNAMRHIEQCLEALAPARMTGAEKWNLLGIVDDFVFGHALREAAGHAPPDLDFAAEQLATGQFPRLQQAFGDVRIEAGHHRLQQGLTALLAREKTE
jgi:AcrR family transcriptional regulator